MRRKGLTLSAAAAIGLAAMTTATAPAGAAFHDFRGDRGTTCRIEVGAFASDTLGALSGPPQVGYSAVPTCQYPAASKSGAGQGRKACRKPKRAGKRGKRRCGHKRKKGAGARAAVTYAATPAVPLAEIVSARLELLGPSGNVTSVGEQTMQAPALGYSCTVGVGHSCADTGRLVPAIPGTDYTAEFSVRVEPPAGETWITRPAGCSTGAVPACELRSATVSPEL